MRDGQAQDFVPRLLRPLNKTHPTQQVGSAADPPQGGAARWISRQKTTAIVDHFASIRHRDRAQAPGVDHDVGPAERSLQTPHSAQTVAGSQTSVRNAESLVVDDPGQSPSEPVPFSKKFQEMFFTIPSFASNNNAPVLPRPSSTPQIEPDINSGHSRPISLPQIKVDDTRAPAMDAHSNVENGEAGLQSFWSALDRFRLSSFVKKTSTENVQEASRNDVLDCLDDNNSIMMYGPLEPDDTSEVEIACSEIVSLNGDGEEVRTPQLHFSPLPSESNDDMLLGYGERSPPPKNIPLPLESINQMLIARSPRPRFVSLPLESIDQVLMGCGGESSSVRGKEGESESLPGAAQAPDTTPAKEYRVWLPSLTKISVQTMWWGFRIYLPPPVLDVLNNKQLEAAKRAAIITTALQWLMDHLPISLLPPQMHPGVTILRHLVPYVGYMGGFIAWTWTAIRSFDKGYGVVLTATWLLPFLLIPGSWEAEEVPTLNTDTQESLAS